MRSPSDPLARLRARARWTWAASIPVLAICGIWAFAPLPVRAAGQDSFEIAASAPAPVEDPFDLRPFQTAHLWVETARPAGVGSEGLAASAPGSPLRLQLLGITSQGGELVACLYDPDEDRILLLRGGERLGAHTVDRVTPREIAFKSEGGEVLVSLARAER